MAFHSDHDLYKTGDPDVPNCITDGNGDVALGLCRRCGRGESELEEPCIVGHATLSSKIAGLSKRHGDDYPLWQGPCGVGPNGGVTQSMLARFLCCRDRFRLKYVCGLEPYDKWHHTFGYGHMWHLCEEMVNSDLPNFQTWESALLEYTFEQCRLYPFQQDDIRKWASVCAVQFPEYIKFWSGHPLVTSRKVLMKERVFDVPYRLPSGRTVRLRGKWDSVNYFPEYVDHEGTKWPAGVYVEDNKTKGDVDEAQIERQLEFDLQTMLYVVALRHLPSCDLPREGYYRHGGNRVLPVGEYPICGVDYNVVRRPLSGGKGSIRPHKATKSKPAETDDQFYERLRADYIAADPSYWFFRQRAVVTEKDVRVFKDQCLDPLLEHLCSWYECVTQLQPGFSRTVNERWRSSAMHYRTPFGVYNALAEGGATEYDFFFKDGNESGLRRILELFTELQ